MEKEESSMIKIIIKRHILYLYDKLINLKNFCY